jgi:hypothetical protein
MAFYSDIKADLQDKPRREQYVILLQTAEWANFRMQILDRLGHVCEQCRTPEQRGIDMSEEKKVVYKAEYDKQLAEFNWRKANFTCRKMYRLKHHSILKFSAIHIIADPLYF